MLDLVPDVLERYAAILNSMGNPKRLEVLLLLTQTEWSVGELAIKVELSQSALSQHLGKLRAERLVVTRRDRQTVYYSCVSRDVHQILSALEELNGVSRSQAESRVAR
ncbi:MULTISPECIES: metalloregulator ArsR/SmtB family transcription factor [unclassified Rhizobium]|uniref:ArsR/SmtB family transcription factor n=1 Tax=unclassified Rhizobium TaxID=2613769 RepID=UPI000B2F67E1|nr:MULTISPECIES: metalloregulator ArsR/SmtB family transcription factor [unclassified Rhizobium]RKD67686.1 ArsR family transcriptional regulator [Rhizobium sp. WW_1]